jgi:hypothetical protein
MTSDDLGQTHATAAVPGHTGRPRPEPRPLDDLLQQQRLVISDITPGAAPGTRRLFLGDPTTDELRFAVAVAHGEGGEEAVSNEAKALATLDERLPEQLAPTVPHIREWVVGPGGKRALVVSAVPGLASSGLPPTTTADLRASLDTLVDWLAGLWHATAGEPVRVGLGRIPVDLMLARYRGAANVRPAIGALLRARGRLAQVEVTSAMTHGCLCARHVFLDGSSIGVDDWGLAEDHADPLRDLGRYAVDITGSRLPEVVEGRSKFAAHVRKGLCSGMEALSAPPRLWRDVLLLAQFEVALTELEHGEASRLSLLQQAVHVLPSRT